MKITSAKFIKGSVSADTIPEDGLPQIAFIGRSNAGKSSLLNSLTSSPKLAITSSTPGRTRQINVFLINGSHYFMDLPGYGYAKAGFQMQDTLDELISWYIFDSQSNPTVVLIVDSEIGPTKDDMVMLKELERSGKDIVIVVNKVDKIKKSAYKKQLQNLMEQMPGHELFPHSIKNKKGIVELSNRLLGEG